MARLTVAVSADIYRTQPRSKESSKEAKAAATAATQANFRTDPDGSERRGGAGEIPAVGNGTEGTGGARERRGQDRRGGTGEVGLG